jgi:hypothetical protein
MSATVLLFEGTPGDQVEQGDVRKIVFERLNTGGQNLNAQEVRNCIYAGSFNALLIRLSQGKLFTDIWEIPSYQDHVDQQGRPDAARAEDRLYRRMIDCEIVLRFFAFRDRSNIKGSVRSMLDNAMKAKQNASEAEITTMARDLETRLELAHSIFESRTFRYQDADLNWKLSQPLYDAVMVALDRLWPRRDTITKKKRAVVRAVTKLFRDEDAYAIIVGRPNTAKAIRSRINLVTRTMARAARLQ